MPDIILHHYAESPFAEKIRLILGYKKLAYRSVSVPMMLPKPDVIALTGGYRKAPTLQIGADIYCDTALMAEVIERIRPQPTLYPIAHAASARQLAAWADQHWFAAGVGYAMQPEGFKSMFAKYPESHRAAFVEDRKAFRAGAPRMALNVATGILTQHLGHFEQQLSDGRAFLLGDAPTIADFAFYHPLWFIQRATAVASFLSGWPQVGQWMKRMAAIGHGTPTELGSSEAIDVARKGETAAPRTEAVNATGPCALGSRVTVAPTDYGIDPVAGELVAEYVNEWVLKRTDPRAGTVYVHFPRFGYQINGA
ncbi:MAG TPA: glutathione S-transferase family protein [Burkholderiales bacterium]|nr:glutathione S-transferase family protein [Burkholderiales bacterium]